MDNSKMFLDSFSNLMPSSIKLPRLLVDLVFMCKRMIGKMMENSAATIEDIQNAVARFLFTILSTGKAEQDLNGIICNVLISMFNWND